jgi:hypothetical protein
MDRKITVCRQGIEFRWKDPGRDDLFGVTSSANTGRIRIIS